MKKLYIIVLFIALLLAVVTYAYSFGIMPAVISSHTTTTGGGGPSATFKGIASGNNDGGTNTISTSGSLSIATNDLLVCFTSRYIETNAKTWQTLTCGSNSLTQAKSIYVSAEHWYNEVWYKEGAASGTTTCTATDPDDGSLYNNIYCVNYSGIATSSALDQSSCNTASCNALSSTSTNMTVQNINTTNANALLIGFVNAWNNTHSWSGQNGYSIRTATTGEIISVMDKSVTSTGTYPSGNLATINSTDTYLSLFISFKVAP